jgi:hypothetical protein
MSVLTYNIAGAFLNGKIGNVMIQGYAGSGGRAGTTTKGAENWYLVNNPLAIGVHHGAHQYGPLPIGKYSMYPHESANLKVRLDPFPTNVMYGRGSFEIHGHGQIGSHGCIVPQDPHVLYRICHAVKQYVDNNDGRPLLNVIAVGGNVDSKFFTA